MHGTARPGCRREAGASTTPGPLPLLPLASSLPGPAPGCCLHSPSGSWASSSPTRARYGAQYGASSTTRSAPDTSAAPTSRRYLLLSRSFTQCFTAGKACEETEAASAEARQQPECRQETGNGCPPLHAATCRRSAPPLACRVLRAADVHCRFIFARCRCLRSCDDASRTFRWRLPHAW